MLSLSTQEGFTFMAHELAHIWFGNIVTVEWWSYVWLNEGFSTFLQFYITDKVTIPSTLKIPTSWDKTFVAMSRNIMTRHKTHSLT